MATRLVVALVALSGCLLVLASASEVSFENPVRSAAEDEVKQLPGLKYPINFRHFSGYLEADDKKNRFWHYWFTESQSNPSEDPLVLWLNGGPGCSSLMGLLTELGPFSVASGGQIKDNPFAWNKKANVIFMESPAGVGFSYAADGSVEANDDTTASQNHMALKSFLRKFPQYANRSLYLTGESYGGVYLPTLAVLVDEDPEMNLKGVAIGNGYLDADKLAESLVFFSYYHGLVGRTAWEGLTKHCCNGKEPARGLCKFTDPNKSAECGRFVTEVTDNVLSSGLNPYNLYDRCQSASSNVMLHANGRAFGSSSRSNFDKSLLAAAFNRTTKPRRHGFGSPKPALFEVLRNDPPCEDDHVTTDYLNQPEVRDALHIPAKLKTPFSTCFDGIAYTMIYPGQKGGLAPQMQKLIASKRNLTLLVYNGDTDMMCNFFGDEWFVDDLDRKVIADYSPWHVNGQVAGFVKHYEGITYMTVKGSGHMVPTDKPAEALHMFNIFLYGHN